MISQLFEKCAVGSPGQLYLSEVQYVIFNHQLFFICFDIYFRNANKGTVIVDHQVARSSSTKNKLEENAHQRRVNQSYRIAAQFFLITIIFIISVLSHNLGTIYGSVLLKYMYFINFIGNPVIYFVVDKSFRVALIKLLKGR